MPIDAPVPKDFEQEDTPDTARPVDSMKLLDRRRWFRHCQGGLQGRGHSASIPRRSPGREGGDTAMDPQDA